MESKINHIIDVLKIKHYFPDYDENLLMIAFIPTDLKFRDAALLAKLYPHFPSKSMINYETLEFYGDTVLYQIIVEMMKNINGVRKNTAIMDNLKQKFTTNRFLRQLSHDHKICDTIYNISPDQKLPLHNKCSDSFEALLGALFVQYGINGLPRIMSWFNDVFSEVSQSILNGLHPYALVPTIDGEQLIERFHQLNPNFKLSQAPDFSFSLQTQGHILGTSNRLDDLIPIIRKSRVSEKWADIVHRTDEDNQMQFLCEKPPFQYSCNGEHIRTSKHNTKFAICKTHAIPVPPAECNLITDHINVADLIPPQIPTGSRLAATMEAQEARTLPNLNFVIFSFLRPHASGEKVMVAHYAPPATDTTFETTTWGLFLTPFNSKADGQTPSINALFTLMTACTNIGIDLAGHRVWTGTPYFANSHVGRVVYHHPFLISVGLGPESKPESRIRLPDNSKYIQAKWLPMECSLLTQSFTGIHLTTGEATHVPLHTSAKKMVTQVLKCAEA